MRCWSPKFQTDSSPWSFCGKSTLGTRGRLSPKTNYWKSDKSEATQCQIGKEQARKPLDIIRQIDKIQSFLEIPIVLLDDYRVGGERVKNTQVTKYHKNYRTYSMQWNLVVDVAYIKLITMSSCSQEIYRLARDSGEYKIVTEGLHGAEESTLHNEKQGTGVIPS